MVNKEEFMRTKSLEEAIYLIFNRASSGRDCIFTQEAMTGCVAREYDYLGRSGRQETYRKLAEDFKRRTGCSGVNHRATGMNVGSILEVGCGSGLLTLELAEQTNSDRIIGLDISEDMMRLAQSNLSRRSKERAEEMKEFKKRLPKCSKHRQDDYKRFKPNPSLLDKIKYVRASVYDLDTAGFQNTQYIVCRNALHRFQYPKKALRQMYRSLSLNGKLYIRDLRRDANWQTLLERIGEKRWQTRTLVEDYIGAMASMLTTQELESTLHSLDITHFKITDGRYSDGEIKSPDNIKEYERDTEYVCIIQK